MLALIDTSVAIELGEVDQPVAKRFAALDEMPLLSVLSLVELEGGLAGISTGREKRRELLNWVSNTLQIVGFDQQHARVYGQIIRTLGFSRPKITDRMIAAQAIVAGATLVTLNPRDFRDIAGLTIENWSA